MFAHLIGVVDTSTTVTDSKGWGAAEWIALATVLSVVFGGISALVRQIMHMRRENTTQHAEGRALVTDVRDRLLDLHESVDRVDSKVDALSDRLENHEDKFHRRRFR